MSNRPQAASMIVLKITNASELVAAKVGRFLERLTPDDLDSFTVEDQVIKKMIESLAAEGLKGEIAAVNGLDIDGEQLVLNEGLKVRQQATF
ncbi:possible 4Fe-4S iron sulfur cluster binding pr [Prochlorococcus marinus str. MIT 9313]|uniref:Possible 4Fe-4S iron sulfur cluster binding pr n=2 Tax=Prochlorococcus marinus TaxID=1219 RepID=Q7V8K9_PROMM|nr:possible 4Fe-4S iron sulfur cluster binding pr [Prochlorococcus marinus str. MIT 9313]